MPRGPILNGELSQRRPGHKIVGLVAEALSISAMMPELDQIGVPAETVLVLHGDDGLAQFDYDGSHHGWWAHLRRVIKNVGGADANILFLYAEGLRTGQYLLFVPVHDDSQRAQVARVLARHRAHSMSYFTRWSMQSIPTLQV